MGPGNNALSNSLIHIGATSEQPWQLTAILLSWPRETISGDMLPLFTEGTSIRRPGVDGVTYQQLAA